MKEILMFILPGCPHCKLALRYQEELLREHPEWQSIPLHIVDCLLYTSDAADEL